MTGPELETARKRLNLTAADLGRTFQLEDRDPGFQIRRWEKGVYPVPGPVAVAVGYMLKELDASKGRPGASPEALAPAPRIQTPAAETGPVAPIQFVSPEASTSPRLKTRRRG